ncbi:non-ribosomal peptide synthetase [Muriicola soli]|uniref:Amino acid adenylation domain-containing protein n=1 Tax=Muriicola soli TaxID=2507538 RepID=A0A411E8P6_9FLAO|nr:non-ribosomal peptide synthetase [Muriicola soli]QBA63904.1 amino acid adenylation domain-containing protein [Muriicola soli]
MKETKDLVKSKFNPFDGPTIERVMHINQSQAEIWVACQIGEDEANRGYNESVSLILKGELQLNILEQSVNEIIQRHQCLRAVFSADGRFMSVLQQIPQKLYFKDLSTLPENKKEEEVEQFLLQEANHIFDLVKGPLARYSLLKLSNQTYRFTLTAHHIVCDGWSIGIFLEELGALYSAKVLNRMPQLPEPIVFESYIDLEQKFLKSDSFKLTENFWLKQFKSPIPQVTLPTDNPRPKLRTYKSARLDFPIEKELLNALKATGVRHGCSFVTTLLAAFEIFLFRQTGQSDVIVGLPAAGQAATGMMQLIGHCVNLLPLRSKIDPNISFSTYLKERKPSLFDAYDHQQFSFGQLLQKLNVSRDPSRVPLVPVVFNIDFGMTSNVSFAGLDYELISNPRTFESFELFLNAMGSEEELILEWSYNSTLFSSESVEQMMGSFKEVLNRITDNPDIAIGDLTEVDNQSFNKLNDTSVTYPDIPLHELISKQAKVFSNKEAIKFGHEVITYEELEKKVNQLSQNLIEHGVQPMDHVAVALPRSIELVVTLLSIMKCGASYIPLDPNYPSARLDFMLKDSESKFLITTKDFLKSFTTDSKVLSIEELFSSLAQYPNTPPNVSVDTGRISYLMYTSGSTGKPKGVMVTHKNLVNFLFSMMSEPGIEESDRLLSITTISFDIAGLEIFLPLLKGATLVMADDETAKDSRLLLELLENENITMLQATPTSWQMLLDVGWDRHLSIKAVCGGEALPLGLAKKILDRVNELWNVYGPTETTIWSSVKQIGKEDSVITIGHPIANTQLYILNEQGNLVPPNTIGEICIAGDGVSEGYWKRPELTNEKFISNPFNKTSVLYRTGDLGKLLLSGEVQCLGRIDQQVKIRGHRIELSEIEQVLDSLDDVNSSVVVVNNDLLVANIIPKNSEKISNDNIDHWKTYLKETLPAHMVPHRFVFMDEFPTTLNGKIDRKTLTNSILFKTDKQETADLTESEKIISTIWQDVLNIEKIDRHNDFFELGGHSLLAVRIMSQIEKQTGNRLPLAALLEYPTISKLAAYMNKEYISWDSLVPLNTNGSKNPIFIVHGANYNVLIFKTLAENLAEDQPVYALQAKGLSGEVEPHDSIEDMAAHYISEILSICPEKPINLAGFSMGGVIAYEMAKQLRAKGKVVKTLSLFDSYVYPNYYFKNPILKKFTWFLYAIAQLIFMVFNMFSSKKNFERRVQLLKIYFNGLFLRIRLGSEKQRQLQFNRTSRIDKMHNRAFMRYSIEPENMAVDLFRSSKNIYFAHDYKYLGWKQVAKGGIRKHTLPGNHSEMFLSPVVEEFANKLQEVLDNYEAE